MACDQYMDCCRDQDCSNSLLTCAFTNAKERLPEVAAALAQRETEA